MSPVGDKTVGLARILLEKVELLRGDVARLDKQVAVLSERFENADLKGISGIQADHEKEIGELRNNWKWMAAIWGFGAGIVGSIPAIFQLIKSIANGGR